MHAYTKTTGRRGFLALTGALAAAAAAAPLSSAAPAVPASSAAPHETGRPEHRETRLVRSLERAAHPLRSTEPGGRTGDLRAL
ncbi:erythromycin esterase family protein, partial [Streptomyces flavochromogenes]